MCAQATFDVSQALAVSQLCEGHAQVLVHAGERFDVALAVVSGHATSEGFVGYEFHHLGENSLSFVHGAPPGTEYSPQ